jgi:hypothetical protein
MTAALIFAVTLVGSILLDRRHRNRMHRLAFRRRRAALRLSPDYMKARELVDEWLSS